jgi:dTDP-glucose 4,6-dehydratase
MNYKNILVTGGCGFIGSNFVNRLLDLYTDIKIICVDKMDYCSNSSYLLSDTRLTVVRCDINEYDMISRLLEEYSIDIVIHFASQTHVDNSFGNSIQFTIDNILGTHTLLECCKVYGKLKRFIHMSTDEVYGEVDISHSGCSEKSLLNPTNPYAATKAGAEFLVRSYYHSYKFPSIIVRCNNVYGPNQYYEKLIPKFIYSLLRGCKCTIQGTGKTRRNFIHVNDVTDALLTVVEMGELNNIYNIGTDNEHSVMDILKILVDKICVDKDYDKHIEYIEDRPFNDFRYAIDSSNLRNLGWSEKINFTDGIKSTVEWYYSHFSIK